MYSAEDWILSPTHNIKVALIGVGGTGSFVLAELVALSKTLRQLNRKELEIDVYDDDKVELHNCGRQKYFESDIGYPKADVLVNRVNRAYGSNVMAYVERATEKTFQEKNYNIIISCVDSLKSRKEISRFFKGNRNYYGGDYKRTFYWIDCGNSKDYGQIIFSSRINNKKKRSLPDIFKLHPKIKEKKSEPSCSVRASLGKQSFMINKLTGVYCIQLLASMLLEFRILHSEIYFSLNPINVKTNSL